jgi:hypothetical protein
MKLRTGGVLTGVLLGIGLAFSSAFAAGPDKKDDKEKDKAKGSVHCKLTFQLHSWAVFYKSGKGNGEIACDNGSKAQVLIRTHGGGLQFGKFNIANGEGKFSPVDKIDELYGKYASAGGHGGAVKSRIGESLSKDDISLDIKGTGTGVDFGFDFGSFRISQATPEEIKKIQEEEKKEAEKDKENEKKHQASQDKSK